MRAVVVAVGVVFVCLVVSVAAVGVTEKVAAMTGFEMFAAQRTHLLAKKDWSKDKGFDKVGCKADDVEKYAGAKMALADLAIAVEYNHVPLVKEAIHIATLRLLVLIRTLWKSAEKARTANKVDAEKLWDIKSDDTEWSFVGRRFGIAIDPSKEVGCDGFKQCFLTKHKDNANYWTADEAKKREIEGFYGKMINDMMGVEEWKKVTLREANHLYGREAEPGEKSNPFHFPNQKGGIRYVLSRIHGKDYGADAGNKMAACTADCIDKGPCGADAACMDAIKATKFLNLDALRIGIDLRNKDLAQKTEWTSDKGFMCPRWESSLMVNARKAYKANSDTWHTGDGPIVTFRAGRPQKDLIDITKGAALGLPVATGEATWNAVKFPQGGEVWVVSNAIKAAKDWTESMKQNLLTVAAGPSGTTDETLTLFDFINLNGITKATFDKAGALTKEEITVDPVGCYLARAHCMGTMAPYFHHSVPEVMEGADNAVRCRGVLEYDHQRPFDTPKQDANGKPVGKVASSVFDFPVSSAAGSSGITNADYTPALFKKAVVTRMGEIKGKMDVWVKDMNYYPLSDVTADNAKAHKYRDENKFGFDAVAQLASDDVGTKCICKNSAFDSQPNFKLIVGCPAKLFMFRSRAAGGKYLRQIQAVLRG